jgi:ABC-type lipoprotein export system ATPase subunit
MGTESEEAKAEALKILERLGLGEKAKRLPSELSRGEYQRVALGRAIILKPMLILADEPTGNLDSKTASEVMEYTLGVCSENSISLVIATHNEKIASLMGRVLSIKDGIIHE